MQPDALVVRGLLGLALFATPLEIVRAQVETNKPTPGGRPAAPVARQLPDGRIEVRWPAVEGAVKYQLSRSVPPVGETVLSPPNPADTVYLDSDVQAGKTYYYVVAAVDQSGRRGTKKGSVPVKASISATPGDSSAVRILPNISTDMVQRLNEVFRSSIPVKFRVYAVCAPTTG